MHRWLLALYLTMGLSGRALADLHYEIRVDGLACPFCTYSVEKALLGIEGVKDVEVDLEGGKVFVVTCDDVNFTDARLTELFRKTGFTYRGMQRHQRGHGEG